MTRLLRVLAAQRMPDGDGTYVVSRLKSGSGTKHVPVIVLTGQRNPNLKRAMLGLGVDAYLQKPLDFAELLRALREHLDRPDEAIGCDPEQLADFFSTMEVDSAKLAEAP